MENCSQFVKLRQCIDNVLNQEKRNRSERNIPLEVVHFDPFGPVEHNLALHFYNRRFVSRLLFGRLDLCEELGKRNRT